MLTEMFAFVLLPLKTYMSWRGLLPVLGKFAGEQTHTYGGPDAEEPAGPCGPAGP